MKIVHAFLFCCIASIGWAKDWAPGYWIQGTGDTVEGSIKFRKIDVPRRALFKDAKGVVTELRVRNTREFGQANIVYKRISFTSSQLGWADTFFMEQVEVGLGAELYYGKVTSEGCGCNGAKFTVTHKWVLLGNEEKMIEVVEEDRWGRIENAAALAALLLAQGMRVDPVELQKVMDLRELMMDHTF